jgi:hypothetical protein
MNNQSPRYISAKDTAKLIRAQLKQKFPGIQFFVRLDRVSVIICWQDGPTTKDVDRVVQPYGGKGFDSMNDLSYYYNAWLMPDGSVAAVETTGTQNSRGMYAPYSPENVPPEAEKVSFDTDYIFTRRAYSRALCERVAEEFSKQSGWKKPEIIETTWYVGKKERGKRYQFANSWPYRDNEIREFNSALKNTEG